MNYQISVDLSGLLNAQHEIIDQLMPRLGQAVRATAEHGALAWKDSVHKARLWSGEKEPYVESITWSMTGTYSAEIVSDYRLAAEIENGRPRKDLKAVLPTAKKARRSKKGSLYLIIPFRHNVPTASGEGAHAPQMPQHVYSQAKGLSPSRVLAPGSKKPAQRVSATGHLVPQHSYNWGGRLPAGLVPKSKPHHKTDRYAGMTRFDTSSGKQKSSAYMTFRVMSEHSNGWIIQPRQGLYLAKGVTDKLGPVFNEIVAKAIQLEQS